MTQLKKDLKIKAKGSLLSAPLILRKYIKIKISVSLKLTAIFCGHKNLYCLVWHPTELLLSLLQSLLLLSLYLLLVYHYYCFYCHCLCFNCIVSKNTLYVMYRVLHGFKIYWKLFELHYHGNKQPCKVIFVKTFFKRYGIELKNNESSSDCRRLLTLL